MITELCVSGTQLGGMKVAAGDGTHQIVMDYPMRPGEVADGLTPLQALLASLVACSANSVKLVLERRMHQTVTGVEVQATAKRSAEHPTVLTEIALDFVVKGPEVDPMAVERAIAISEEDLCPVWNMLKVSTPIAAEFRVVTE